MPIIGVIASSAKGAPGIPTIGTVTDVGTGRAYNNGAASVPFTAGAGATATSFTVKAYTTGGSYTGLSATGASSPLVVTGLSSSVQYKYTVFATNAAGNSLESGFSNTVTATTVPQAPTVGTATATSSSTATVAFTDNATGGFAITNHTATSSPSSITGTSATSPITVSGLAASTSYTFTVTATNANGTSAASSASNSITTSAPPAILMTMPGPSLYKTTDSGANWSYVTSLDSNIWNTSLSTNGSGKWVISGKGTSAGNTAIWYSTNQGSTWTKIEKAITGSALLQAGNSNNLAQNNNGYWIFAVPTSNPAGMSAYIIYSTDAITWTSQSLGQNNRDGRAAFYHSSSGRYWVVLDNGGYVYSTNLSTWTLLNYTNGVGQGAKNADGSVIVMSSSNNKVITFNSTYQSGSEISSVTGATFFDPWPVFANGVFLARTNSADPYAIATSTNGINWTARNNPWYNGSIGMSGCIGGNVFVATNDQGTRGWATSSDGATWTIRANNTPTSDSNYNQGGAYGS